MIVGSALRVLIEFYREFFRGHMAELSRALALALLYIDEHIFDNESFFSVFYGKCPFKVWCQSVLY